MTMVKEQRLNERFESADAAARSDWLGLLSRSRRSDIEALALDLSSGVEFEWLRKPQVGLVMVRGRAGGMGAAFNLGEMTITRCALQLASGIVGHGYAQGRDRRQAKLAAILDALLQQPDRRPALLDHVIEPLRAIEQQRRAAASRRAASTKVEFFTMVRGDNLA